MDKVHAKLDKWKRFNLSRGGRASLSLCKSVLFNLPTYYMSTFLMPEGVISKPERILRNFFWEGQKGSKINHLVGWETVTRDLVDGGGYKARNMALLVKWGWRYLEEEDSLWCKVWEVHGKVPYASLIPLLPLGKPLYKAIWKYGSPRRVNILFWIVVVGNLNASTVMQHKLPNSHLSPPFACCLRDKEDRTYSFSANIRLCVGKICLKSLVILDFGPDFKDNVKALLRGSNLQKEATLLWENVVKAILQKYGFKEIKESSMINRWAVLIALI
ncbi:uncharacterized protein E5676_scaffold16G00380 [Cucumis melo var. makuwa]|uniref:Reverse transcriptase zinc-binding domain-containing protein n=1 Tax=Cucumis melo var. makuwa TaxID=1194695 RepID=A0A5D3CF41_CUCMM|nr:uncharacterized protein E5676_scaffold16G00380 [Cucumis melo var. makuwa]